MRAQGTSPSAGLPGWITRAGLAAWAFVGMGVAAFLVFSLLVALQDLVVPLVTAVVGAVVAAPLVDRLERRGIPRALAALLTTTVVVVLIAGVVAVVVVGVVWRADELQNEINRGWAQLSDAVENSRVAGVLTDLEPDVSDLGGTIARGAGAGVGQLVGSAIGLLSGSLLGLVLLYYLLEGGRSFLDRLDELDGTSTSKRARAARIVQAYARTLRANARGRTVLAAAQGAFTFAAMAVLGVPLPASIAIVTFVGAFVPFLGAFVGGAFAVLMALSEGGVDLAVLALAAVLVTNLVLENLLEPRVLASRIRLHPIVILTATVAGGVVAGLLGLILAGPAVAIARNVFVELRADDPPYRGQTMTAQPEKTRPQVTRSVAIVRRPT